MDPPVEIKIDGEVETGETQFKSMYSKRAGRTINIAFQPSHVRQWQTTARILAQKAMEGRTPMDCQLKLTLRLYLPVPSSFSKRKREMALQGVIRPAVKPDLSNALKTIEDSLQGIVFTNDSRIVTQDNQKWYSAKPCVLIKVEPETLGTWLDLNASQPGLFKRPEV